MCCRLFPCHSMLGRDTDSLHICTDTPLRSSYDIVVSLTLRSGNAHLDLAKTVLGFSASFHTTGATVPSWEVIGARAFAPSDLGLVGRS